MKQLFSKDLKEFLLANPSTVLLDVRQDYEHQWCAIPNSILIPLNELPDRLDELSNYKNQNIIVYCKAGIRSQYECDILEDNGYHNLYNLTDGILGWQNTLE